MTISRRRLLTVTGAAVAAAAIDATGLNSIARAATQTIFTNTAVPTSVFGTGQAGTTLAGTVLPGVPNAKGYRGLIAAGGEPVTVREDITTAATQPTVMLAAFAHLSDLHVIDDQSPARVEYLDAYANPALPHKASYPTDSAYRPHEFMSTQLVDAMARSLDKIGYGPASNLPLSFAVVTGDAVDNAQLNETRWYIDLLDGNKSVTPNSGRLDLDISVSSILAGGHRSDANYWHPNKPATAVADEVMFKTFGFQPMPGLLAAARRTFTSNGVGIPWFAVYGNHDRMVQGNLPVGTDLPIYHSIKFLAVNDQKIVESTNPLDDVYDPGAGFYLDAIRFLRDTLSTTVPVDPFRRLLSPSEFVGEHFKTAGLPVGHGFRANSSLAYYAMPDSPSSLVRYITLDSTNEDGGLTGITDNASGCIDDAQFKWLEQQLIINSSRYLDANGNQVVQTGVQDKLFVIFAHHTIATMTNLHGDSKHSGAELTNLLHRFPNVVLLANGHTHRNEITPHARPAGSRPLTVFGNGGFWEVSAASHIDWPIQSRIIELGVGGNTLSIFTSVVDIDAPLTSVGTFNTPDQIASIARELAVNDPQEHYEDGRSTLVPVDMTMARRGASGSHRNAQLVLPMPFTTPAYTALSGPRFFPRDPDGTLFQFTTTAADLVEIVKSGTFPAAATTSSGSWLVAFQRNDGLLWQVTSHGASAPVGGVTTLMSTRSSPAAAGLPTGGVVIAFQRNDNTLNAFTTDGFSFLSVAMQAGTSPAVAALPHGGNFVAAAHGSDGMLWIATRAGRSASTTLPMQTGTNPAIASSPSGAYTVTFHGSDGTLWTVTHNGTSRSLNLPVAAGTSPSIAAIGSGYAIAFHHTDGTLWSVAPNGAAGSTSLPMAPGTSPSISSSGSGFEISFHHTNGNGWLRETTGQADDLKIKMVAGSSPANATSFLSVAPPSQHYTINATARTGQGDAGGTFSTTVTLSPFNGFSGSVALSADGLPIGITASFSRTTINAALPTSVVTFAVPALTPAGDYPVRILTNGLDRGPGTAIDYLLRINPTFRVTLSQPDGTWRGATPVGTELLITPINSWSEDLQLEVFVKKPAPMIVSVTPRRCSA